MRTENSKNFRLNVRSLNSALYRTSNENSSPYVGQYPTRNIQVGDIVMLQEDNLIPTKWPLAKVIDINPSKDGLVQVVTIMSNTGIYNRSITKIALLLPSDPQDSEPE